MIVPPLGGIAGAVLYTKVLGRWIAEINPPAVVDKAESVSLSSTGEKGST